METVVRYANPALPGALNPHVLHVHSGCCAPGALTPHNELRFPKRSNKIKLIRLYVYAHRSVAPWQPKAYSPQTNGICERFHKTMKNECYDVMFRRKIYLSLEEIQQDIDKWLVFYNRERPHSGRYYYGKTPWETWVASKGLVKEKQLDNVFKLSDSQTTLKNRS